MDSVTQFVLGAAIGEATLRPTGRESGKRRFGTGAVILGGLVATIPDLDVLTAPFLDGPTALASHRGLSHSLFFCTLLTPFLGLFLQRLFPDYGVSRKRWFSFVWLALNTHWMLDCFTMYGTQIFQPFSNYPVNGSSIFIIDPVYTLSLAAGIVWSLWSGRGGREPRAAGVRWGLALSTLYLLAAVLSKGLVMKRFDHDWATKGIPAVSRITVPTPFNIFLWYCYVDTGDEVWVSHSSLWDSEDRELLWQRVPKNKDLLPGFGQGPAGRVLIRFSRGFYRLEMQDGKPVFIDLRFGRARSWLRPQEPQGRDYVFRFFLEPAKPSGPYHELVRLGSEESFGNFPWKLFWRRVWGRE